MRIFRNIFYISTILIFLTCTCTKDEDSNPFPPNTATGANTFMFRVDGGEVINSQVGYLAAKPRIRIFYNHNDPYFEGMHYFEFAAGKLYLGENKFVSFYISNMKSVGIYKLSNIENYASYDDLAPTEHYYFTNDVNIGELIITTLDTVSHIISGTFRFDAKQWCLTGNCNNVVTVEGQFDVAYTPNKGVNYY